MVAAVGVETREKTLQEYLSERIGLPALDLYDPSDQPTEVGKMVVRTLAGLKGPEYLEHFKFVLGGVRFDINQVMAMVIMHYAPLGYRNVQLKPDGAILEGKSTKIFVTITILFDRLMVSVSRI
jgi:hypothetical protein